MFRTAILCLLFQLFSLSSIAEETSVHFKSGNFDKAFREAYLNINVREKGVASDYLILGKIILSGLGNSRKDAELGIRYVQDAIEKGSDEAILYLAEQYESGQHIDRDIPKALRYYELAKDSGKSGLETKIASLANEMASGELTKASCEAAIEASNADKSDFYIFAAKCLAESNQNIDMAIEWLTKKFRSGEEKESLEAIGLLADRKSPIFSPLVVIRLGFDEEYRNNRSSNYVSNIDEVVNSLPFHKKDCVRALDSKELKIVRVVCDFVVKNGALPDVKDTLGFLAEQAPSTPGLTKHLLLLVQNILENTDKQHSLMVVDFLESKLGPLLGAEATLAATLELLANHSVEVDTRTRLEEFVSSVSVQTLASLNGDKDSILNEVKVQSSGGNCHFMEMVFNNENVEIAFAAYPTHKRNSNTCLAGSLELLTDGLEGYPKRSSSKARKSLKKLCSKRVLNACYALGISYHENYGEVLSKLESLELAEITLSRNIDSGHKESALGLLKVYKDMNKRDNALALADKAYSLGLTDALFLKADILLAKIFSGKKACKPLLRFISESDESSEYWEDALKLKSKKCKS